MQRYEITGMSCAACASHVEKAVSAVPGVAGVAVSLLTNSMQAAVVNFLVFVVVVFITAEG